MGLRRGNLRHRVHTVHVVSAGPPLAVRLWLPPVMALVTLYVCHNTAVATSPGGSVSESNRNLTWVLVGVVFGILEVFSWWAQITAFWLSDPLGLIATVSLLGWVTYYAAAKWIAARRRARQIPTVHYEFRQTGLGLESTVRPSQQDSRSPAPAQAGPRRAPPRTLGLRIRQAIVLVWAVLGLAGGLIAILLHVLRKR